MVRQVVVAALGGATQQAVSCSGDPRRWLASRVRQALVPQEGEGDLPVPKSTQEDIRGRAKAFLQEAVQRLQALPAPKTGGRPAQRSPEDLAAFLGVCHEPGDDLVKVFARYLRGALKDFTVLLIPGLFLIDLWQRLDTSWLPLWVNAQPLYPGLFGP